MAQPKYDNHYTVVGRVISGMDVLQKLQKNDVIRTVTVREAK
jgi:cyclophilin family peptidyl-prolyl cis-trans isomerase